MSLAERVLGSADSSLWIHLGQEAGREKKPQYAVPSNLLTVPFPQSSQPPIPPCPSLACKVWHLSVTFLWMSKAHLVPMEKSTLDLKVKKASWLSWFCGSDNQPFCLFAAAVWLIKTSWLCKPRLLTCAEPIRCWSRTGEHGWGGLERAVLILPANQTQFLCLLHSNDSRLSKFSCTYVKNKHCDFVRENRFFSFSDRITVISIHCCYKGFQIQERIHFSWLFYVPTQNCHWDSPGTWTCHIKQAAIATCGCFPQSRDCTNSEDSSTAVPALQLMSRCTGKCVHAQPQAAAPHGCSLHPSACSPSANLTPATFCAPTKWSVQGQSGSYRHRTHL